MLFSIITPTWNRVSEGRLKRCIDSVIGQSFPDFEHIIVDDGSTDETYQLVESYNDERLKYVWQKHQGRVFARNLGFKKANGLWLYWVDSDDAIDPECLATFRYYMFREPEARLFVCSAVVHGMHKDDEGKHVALKWTKLRKSWMPPVDCNGVHEIFRSGKVGAGMFCYARECLEKTGLLPPWKNHNQIADGIDEWLGLPPGTTGYSTKTRLVGNPWGEDHAAFQKLCLFYRVYLIEAALYRQYVR